MSASYMARAALTDIQVARGSGTTVAACKLALIILASCVDPKAPRRLAFPSMDERVRRSGQDKRTIRLCDAELIRQGLIADTGERRGRTGQITVYSFPAWESAKGDNLAPLSTGKAGQKEGQQEGQYCPPYREDRSYPSDMSDRERLSLSNIVDLRLSGEAESKCRLWSAEHAGHVEQKFRAYYDHERHSRAQWDAKWCKWVLSERDPPTTDVPANPLIRAALALQAEGALLEPYRPRVSDHGN